MEKRIDEGANKSVTVDSTNILLIKSPFLLTKIENILKMKTVMICPYCNRSHRFDIRYGEGDVIWRRLRPAKTWMAPIFGKGEYAPTITERCECGAMFIFARNPKEAIAGLRGRRGRKRPMSVEKTNVKIDGFTGYAVKRVIMIKKSEMTVARKYRAEFIRIVIPSEIPVKEGVYAVYHDGDNLILKHIGEGVAAAPSPEAKRR